jgi:hypothetical protein
MSDDEVLEEVKKRLRVQIQTGTRMGTDNLACPWRKGVNLMEIM